MTEGHRCYIVLKMKTVWVGGGGGDGHAVTKAEDEKAQLSLGLVHTVHCMQGGNSTTI